MDRECYYFRNCGILWFIGFLILLIVITIIYNSIESCEKEKYNPSISASKISCKKNLAEKEYLCIDKNVNVIPNECFKELKQLKRIDFKGDVYYLGKDTFSGCTNLEEINFYGKLDYYDSSVFNNLSSLKRLSINEINIILYNSFANLTNLEYVSINNGLEIIEDGAFKNCNKLQFFRLPISTHIIKDESIINSDCIEFIYPNYHKIKCGQKVFWNNSFINTLIIPDNIPFLSEWMFAFCTNLEYVEIPDSVSKINKHCFSACQNIKEIKYYSDFHNFASIYPSYNVELNSNCRIKTTDYPNGKTVAELIIENEK